MPTLKEFLKLKARDRFLVARDEKSIVNPTRRTVGAAYRRSLRNYRAEASHERAGI